MFVGCIIVEDDVNDFSGRYLGIDGIQEANELLMPVTLPSSTSRAAKSVVVPCRL